MQPLLLTTGDVAAMLNTSERVVQRLMREGYIVAFRLCETRESTNGDCRACGPWRTTMEAVLTYIEIRMRRDGIPRPSLPQRVP